MNYPGGISHPDPYNLLNQPAYPDPANACVVPLQWDTENALTPVDLQEGQSREATTARARHAMSIRQALAGRR